MPKIKDIFLVVTIFSSSLALLAMAPAENQEEQNKKCLNCYATVPNTTVISCSHQVCEPCLKYCKKCFICKTPIVKSNALQEKDKNIVEENPKTQPIAKAAVSTANTLTPINLLPLNPLNKDESKVPKHSDIVWPGPRGYKIIEINPNLYTAKIPNENLTLVMERVTSDNYLKWQIYADWQSNPKDTRYLEKNYGINIQQGTEWFEKVLKESSYTNNEIWVAYITTSPSPTAIPDSMYIYRGFGNSTDFAEGIQMFLTVTSSPNAKITSHMGIAASAEAVASGRRPRGISLDLHSFAAKVMVTRNPELRYMINAPATAMEKIMLKGLPAGAVNVGTKEMLAIMNIWKTNPDAFQFPFPLSAYSTKEERAKDFIELSDMMSKNPPILSVDGADYKSVKNKLVIFEKDGRPWLTINRSDPNYRWIFDKPFAPSGGTHYIAVDLKCLAAAR
jgi:hypothetical protein